MSQIVISLTASVAQYCFSHLHCSFDTVVREHLDNVDMRIGDTGDTCGDRGEDLTRLSVTISPDQWHGSVAVGHEDIST